MSATHGSLRTRSRLIGVVALVVFALGAIFATAASAQKETTLAMGDSLAFGYSQKVFNENLETGVKANKFEKGYNNDYFTKTKPKVGTEVIKQLVNFGCPGETSKSLIGNGELEAGLKAGEEAALEKAYGKHIPVEPFGEAPCAYHNGTHFPLHHEYGENGKHEPKSQLEAVLQQIVGDDLVSEPVTTVTLDIGSNDELHTLGGIIGEITSKGDSKYLHSPYDPTPAQEQNAKELKEKSEKACEEHPGSTECKELTESAEKAAKNVGEEEAAKGRQYKGEAEALGFEALAEDKPEAEAKGKDAFEKGADAEAKGAEAKEDGEAAEAKKVSAEHKGEQAFIKQAEAEAEGKEAGEDAAEAKAACEAGEEPACAELSADAAEDQSAAEALGAEAAAEGKAAEAEGAEAKAEGAEAFEDKGEAEAEGAEAQAEGAEAVALGHEAEEDGAEAQALGAKAVTAFHHAASAAVEASLPELYGGIAHNVGRIVTVLRNAEEFTKVPGTDFTGKIIFVGNYNPYGRVYKTEGEVTTALTHTVGTKHPFAEPEDAFPAKLNELLPEGDSLAAILNGILRKELTDSGSEAAAEGHEPFGACYAGTEGGLAETKKIGEKTVKAGTGAFNPGIGKEEGPKGTLQRFTNMNNQGEVKLTSAFEAAAKVKGPLSDGPDIHPTPTGYNDMATIMFDECGA